MTDIPETFNALAAIEHPRGFLEREHEVAVAYWRGGWNARGIVMTITESKLIETGNALAQSIGHQMARGCPKLSPAVPCTCGAKDYQAQALSDWFHLIDSIKES